MSRAPLPSVFAAEVNNLALHIASRLNKAQPDAPMDEAARLTLARHYATERYGYNPERAADAERRLLVLAPMVRPDQTRSEYGTLLRLVVRGVAAR